MTSCNHVADENCCSVCSQTCDHVNSHSPSLNASSNTVVFDGKYYKPTKEEGSDNNFRGVLEPGLCLGAYFDFKYGQLIKGEKKEGKMC